MKIRPEPLFPEIQLLPLQLLDRWYRSEESAEWDDVEAAATRAQSISIIEE
jgi:hypothetical protein